MGDPQGVLGTLPGGGAVVYLPDFSLAIISPPGTPDHVQAAQQIVLPSIQPAAAGSRHRSMLDRLLNSFSGSSQAAAPSSPNQLRAVFKQDTDTFHLIDYSSMKSFAVTIPGVDIRSIRRHAAPASSGGDSWIVSGFEKGRGGDRSAGDELRLYSVAVSASETTAVCTPLHLRPQEENSTTACSPGWDDHHHSSWKTENCQASTPSGGASWGASTTAHYGDLLLSGKSPNGLLTVWPRTERVGNRAKSTISQVASSLMSKGTKDILIHSTNTSDNVSVSAALRSPGGRKGAPKL